MRKLLLMLLSFTMVSLIAIGQSRTAFDLSGKVIANRDGDPVVGAFVYVEGSKNATSTDNAGHFSIKVLPSQKIIVSMIGFKNKTIVVGNQNNIEIALDEDNYLDEVVVVGYGTQRRKDLVGAVEQIKGETLNTRANSGAVRALQGQIPGLTLEFSDGKLIIRHH